MILYPLHDRPKAEGHEASARHRSTIPSTPKYSADFHRTDSQVVGPSLDQDLSLSHQPWSVPFLGDPSPAMLPLRFLCGAVFRIPTSTAIVHTQTSAHRGWLLGPFLVYTTAVYASTVDRSPEKAFLSVILSKHLRQYMKAYCRSSDRVAAVLVHSRSCEFDAIGGGLGVTAVSCSLVLTSLIYDGPPRKYMIIRGIDI